MPPLPDAALSLLMESWAPSLLMGSLTTHGLSLLMGSLITHGLSHYYLLLLQPSLPYPTHMHAPHSYTLTHLAPPTHTSPLLLRTCIPPHAQSTYLPPSIPLQGQGIKLPAVARPAASRPLVPSGNAGVRRATDGVGQPQPQQQQRQVSSPPRQSRMDVAASAAAAAAGAAAAAAAVSPRQQQRGGRASPQRFSNQAATSASGSEAPLPPATRQSISPYLLAPPTPSLAHTAQYGAVQHSTVQYMAAGVTSACIAVAAAATAAATASAGQLRRGLPKVPSLGTTRLPVTGIVGAQEECVGGTGVTEEAAEDTLNGSSDSRDQLGQPASPPQAVATATMVDDGPSSPDSAGPSPRAPPLLPPPSGSSSSFTQPMQMAFQQQQQQTPLRASVAMASVSEHASLRVSSSTFSAMDPVVAVAGCSCPDPGGGGEPPPARRVSSSTPSAALSRSVSLRNSLWQKPANMSYSSALRTSFGQNDDLYASLTKDNGKYVLTQPGGEPGGGGATLNGLSIVGSSRGVNVKP